jgi:hypothetical protein
VSERSTQPDDLAPPADPAGDPGDRRPFWRRLVVNLGISLAVGALFGYLAFRGLRPGELGDAFAGADYRWLAPYLLSLAAVQLFRAWRWRFLLEPVAPVRPSFGRLFAISSVGFGAIILLPFRLGEFVRPFLIADPAPAPEEAAGAPRLRASAALGTVALERVVDGLLVSLFLFVSFWFLADRPGSPGWMMPTAYTALAGFGGATVFLIAGLARPTLAVDLVLRLSLITLLARRLGGRWARLEVALRSLLGGLISGLSSLFQARCLFAFVALSLLYWVFNGLGFWLLARAFHLDLPLWHAYAICGVIVVGIILPSGPGLVGNFHEFGRLGLQLGLPAAVVAGPGMAYIVASHGLQFIWYVGVGLLCVRSRHVPFRRLLQAARGQAPTAEG